MLLSAARSGIQIRTARPDERDTYVALMSDAFPPADYHSRFEWQYFKHPSFCELIFAEIEGHVAGMVGIEMRRLFDGTPCAMLIDLAIRSEHRGRGLSYVLEEELVRRAKACG